VDSRAGALRTKEPPPVRRPPSFPNKVEQVFLEKGGGGIVVEKGLGRLVVVERAVENVQGGIVLVVAGVGEKVGKLQAERVSVVRLATFEFPVEEGKRV